MARNSPTKPEVPGRPTLAMVKTIMADRVERHPLHEAAIGGDLAGVHPVVDHADAEEERAGDDAVRDHQEQGALDALLVHGEEAQRHEAHMRHRRIGDELLDVGLHQRDQRGEDDRDHREREHHRREGVARVREHRQRDPDEAVAAHLQEDARQDHRAGGRRLHVRVRQPGMDRPHRHLHREGGEEGEPEPGLELHREAGVQQGRDVGGAGVPVHRHDGEQHQHRAEQGVEEELEAGVDAPLAAPDADDEEHRDQAGLEEQVEQHQVEGREHADHRRLEDEEGDEILLHPGVRSSATRRRCRTASGRWSAGSAASRSRRRRA